MRKSVSPRFARTVPRVLVAVLLAGVATGCSSDATRFGGLFSSSDDMTTGSIPRSGGNVGYVPRGDVNGASGAVAANQGYASQGTVSNAPMPMETADGSGVRRASTPMSVQRNTLSEPSAAPASAGLVAMAQPIPANAAPTLSDAFESPARAAAPAPKRTDGWSTANAPVVMLRSGESIKTLSTRYGVPEKEILKANGLKTAAAAEPGQKITIPVFGTARSAAKASIDTALDPNGKRPGNTQDTGAEVAILPNSAKNRDKTAGEAGKGKVAAGGDGKPEGGYEVQPGDSLAKIAARNGVSVDALKQANGLNGASIRVGQKLHIPAASRPATDGTMTASLPDPKKTAAPVTEKAEAYAPVEKKQTLSEIETKTDITEAAPESTGIGKYRWPVRGAVIAGYGSNVEGSRNDGIDISVPEGTPVKAAENGVVIYSGSSLKELGNAVLVRHDDGTVTVYGHASSLNVQRGQKVQRGQTLASSGMSGNATRPKLHFEVRKNASAVNPMTYLE
ncbi:peptidoglycan DD-metalloendopeptidase family protein [Rhizobium sp. GN54]|uniref:peptidoglycan DD-metalloendopeptidase family protein n=1 Tax=Rhizobium sp. GN54 TaxID=2898150 RepID=UPI001E64C57B|nr:peptidoglycan DD-metalloendopeptidase family protein [Rhizobium sp. GN54]MCD2181587.1 peptidoglycan DD-metalloendopeptidase family protein [Rhizobium sp. GN54]